MPPYKSDIWRAMNFATLDDRSLTEVRSSMFPAPLPDTAGKRQIGKAAAPVYFTCFSSQKKIW